MPVVPKLDTVLELRFYRQTGVSSETVYGRRDLRIVEHAPRTSAPPSKLERVRYLMHNREDMRAALLSANTQAPVRLYDANVGIEYAVNSIDDLPGGRRMVVNASAFVPSQR